MKNRSKILSPRDTQIRRELSNSAEFAASGFSGIYSSAKNQLKKVISKLSGACSTAMHLIFPNPEISVQERDMYSFNLKLESISDTIKNPLPGPKPLHLDSYTMPPTPGRFLPSEDSGNQKEKIAKLESRVDLKTKPEYGVPAWKQLGTCAGNRDRSVIQTNEKLRNIEKPPPGSDGIRKVKENPNSTPIRPAEKMINKQNPGLVRTAGSDPDKRTPQFFQSNDRILRSDEREKENFESRHSDFNAADGDSFSFMDKEDRNEVKDEKKTLLEQKFLGTKAKTDENCSAVKQNSKDFQDTIKNELQSMNEPKENIELKSNDQQAKVEPKDSKNIGNNEVGKPNLPKVSSFFVSELEKKFEEMEEGFMNSKSTSKTSSPSKRSESEISASDLLKNPNLKPDQDLKKTENKPNPGPKATEQPEKPVYMFGSSSNPFVTRENTSTASSNPFLKKSLNFKLREENPLKISAKPEVKNPFASNHGVQNPFSTNLSVQNPFSQSSAASGGIPRQTAASFSVNSQENPFLTTLNPFSPMTSEPFRSQPQSLSSNTFNPEDSSNKIKSTKNNFETSLRGPKTSNPYTQTASSFASNHAVLNNFPLTSEERNPFASSSNTEAENKADSKVLYTGNSHLNQEPKKIRDEGKSNEKIVNPFALPVKEEKTNSDVPLFVLGVMPSRTTSQVKRNNK